MVGLDLCVPYHPKFPLASQEGGGRPHIWSPPSASPLYSRSCFYSVEILSRVVTTRRKQRPAAPYTWASLAPHPLPQSFFIITSGWDGHAMSRRVPPRRPKNRFPPQQGCPGDPSAPGGGRAQHVSLNRAAHQLRDPKLAFLSQPPHVRPSGPVK